MARDLEALLRHIEARQTVAFAWAQPRDCVSFALIGVREQCGWNPMQGLTWTTRRGALRVVNRLGGLEAALDARMMRIAPARALRGDVAGVADDLLGVRLMIVEGETLIGPGAAGLKRMPRAAMIRAWSAEAPPPAEVAGDV